VDGTNLGFSDLNKEATENDERRTGGGLLDVGDDSVNGFSREDLDNGLLIERKLPALRELNSLEPDDLLDSRRRFEKDRTRSITASGRARSGTGPSQTFARMNVSSLSGNVASVDHARWLRRPGRVSGG
jgi:hypothetical protein